LSLTEDFDHELIGQPPFFELNLVDAQKTDDAPAEVLDFSTYRQEENVFQSSEEPGLAPTVGDRKVVSKLWRSFEVALATSENDLHKHVSQELQNLKPRPRLIWEVYAGASRLAEVADSLRCQVESFGYETGWILTWNLTGLSFWPSSMERCPIKFGLHRGVACGAR
jgi:hypothetical protein